MRRASAVVLWLLLVYSNMEGYQFFKTGILYSHFTSHVKQDPDVSFFSLLLQHYTDNDAERNDTDRDEDQQLPFKDFTSGTASVLFFPAEQCRIPTMILYAEKQFNLYKDEFFELLPPGSVFKPPAVVV